MKGHLVNSLFWKKFRLRGKLGLTRSATISTENVVEWINRFDYITDDPCFTIEIRSSVKNVLIQGDGVAAFCSAHLLRRAGFRVSLRRTDRPRLPAILLSDAALALIRDVFERPDLLREAPRIQRRIVAWRRTDGGESGKPLVLEHAAAVVSEQSLLQNLEPAVPFDDEVAGREANWTIFASRPFPQAVTEQRYGTRVASAVEVDLKGGCDSAACWIESLENGWLFLIPNAPGAGWLLAVGGAVEQQLARSRVIADQIARFRVAGEFPAYPRIASPLCGSGWLACGTAAMAFDPLCGDGTAHAVREAILAAAVIRALAAGGNAGEIFSHYEARLTAGFQRHLALCREFYRSGHGGPWWDAELEPLEQGIASLSATLARTEFRYQLNGFELKRLGGD